jgi:hypothetical protein
MRKHRTLTRADSSRLVKDIKRVDAILRKTGFRQAYINTCLQTDLCNVCMRKSIACPYEVLRAQHWCLVNLPPVFGSGDDLISVTLGSPKERPAIGELADYDPANLFRKFRNGIASLKQLGTNDILAFFVFELQLCRPLEGDLFYEPHLHAIIKGSTSERIKKALKVRSVGASKCRNRPLHTKVITDLEGMIGYCTKLYPKMQVQYQTDSHLRWRENRVPAEFLPEWYTYMARLSAGDVLKFIGINGRDLNRPLTDELSLAFLNGPRGWQ